MLGRLQKPFLQGDSQQLSDRMRIQLAHQTGPVLVDRAWADPEVVGELGVGFAAREAEKDLPFAWGQFRAGLAPREKRLGHGRKDDLSGVHLAQAVGENTHVFRFEKNARSAAFVGVGKDAGALETGHDDNPGLGAPSPRFLDDFDPCHMGHGNIKQHDIRPLRLDRRDRVEPVVDFGNNVEPAGSLQRELGPHSDDFMIIADDDANPLHFKALPWRIGFYIKALLVLSLVLIAPFTAKAQPIEPVTISPNSSTATIAPNISYFLEDEAQPLTLAQARERWENGEFSPVDRSEPSFGYREGGIWLHFSVRNTSDEELERTVQMGTNFMLETDVFSEHGGAVQHWLSLGPQARFSERPVDYHELAVPVVFPARSETAVWIRYRSGGATALPVNLDTNTGFVGRVSAKLTKDFTFYGIMVMFVLVSAGATIISSTRLFGSYCLYVISTLAYLCQRDGYAFQFLWPNAPEWNAISSLPMGALMGIMAANFALVYLGKRRAGPIVRFLLFAIIAVQVAQVAAATFIDPRVLKQTAVITMTASILVFLLIGIRSWLKEGRQLLFFVIGWFGIVVASLTMFAFHTLGLEISREQNLDTMRAAIVFDAFMMGLASITGLLMQQRERGALLREREAAMTATVELQARLNRLEKRAELASALALSSSRKIANTAHDLRQPLYALREMIADLLANATPPPNRSRQIEQSLAFMEELVSSTLDRATSEEGIEETVRKENGLALMSVGRILQALETMFADDAKRSGNDLRIDACTMPLRGDPVAVLRILANFVSNAIRHAPGSIVHVCITDSPHAQIFEVRDTGQGMSAEKLALSKQRHQTTIEEENQGNNHGLGLSIVDELTRVSGFTWSIESSPGAGTKAVLQIPTPPISDTDDVPGNVVALR